LFATHFASEAAMTFFDIALKTEASLHPFGHPEEFISEYVGFIRAEGEDGVLRRVGKVHASRIRAEDAAADGEPLFEVCDAHSHEMHVVQTLLYEPNGYELKEEVVRAFDVLAFDCLVFDYVILHPKWRGLKLGLLAVRKTIDLVGVGCGLVVCDIAPLRHEAHSLLKVPASWLPEHETVEQKKAGVRKLRRYFRRLGFRRIDKCPYFYLSMTRQAPSLADLLKPSA
jgi:hypothetical protein